MKKLIAALLVLTMVLALTGTAMAGCKYKEGDWIKFNKNAVAYKTKGGKKTSTIVKKGSVAYVVCDQKYDKWVKVGLEYWWDEDAEPVTRWFKTADVKADPGYFMKDEDGDWIVDEDGNKVVFHTFKVVYSQGGNGLSKVLTDEDGYYEIPDDGDWLDEGGTRISKDCMKHVKATAKVWIHKLPCLKKSYGEALRKNDKVVYKRVYAIDSRSTIFYKIKYKGNCNLWVSSAYTKLVK